MVVERRQEDLGIQICRFPRLFSGSMKAIPGLTWPTAHLTNDGMTVYLGKRGLISCLWAAPYGRR